MNNLAIITLLLQYLMHVLAGDMDPSTSMMWRAMEQNLLSLSVTIVGLVFTTATTMKMLE